MNEERTMAIYPNTLGFGFVVLDSRRDVVDHGIVTVRPINNVECLRRIQDIISYHQPKTLILEDCQKSKKSHRIRKLVNDMESYVKYSIEVFKYSRADIRNAFDIFGARNKFEISKKLTETYPELENKLPEKRKLWKPEGYYQGIFDSLSLVYTHYYLKG